MKNIILMISIGFITLSCKSQNIVSIYDTPWDLPSSPIYYKDTENDFNKFKGTWKWQNGNNSWTIELKKIDKFERKYEKYTKGSFYYKYFDFLVGEYKYVQNGIIKVNSLPTLINETKDPYNKGYSFFSSDISTDNRGFPPCNECAPNTRFIIGKIIDPTRPGLSGKIRMAVFTENGVEKIRLRITYSNPDPSIIGPDYSGPDTITIPSGVYTLVKQ